MLISLNWLRDYVDIPADLASAELAERITVTTAEVDKVEHVTRRPPEIVLPPGTTLDSGLLDDWIIEIDNKSITHRPDLWGHYGIAREVAAIVGRPLKPLPVEDAAALAPAGLAEIPIVIDDATQCTRYSGLRMRGLGARQSPDWMQVRLARVGVRPINLLVDLTNYVMCEVGQPMHAFDAATIDRIEVGLAGQGERFTTLDGVERVMPCGTLMIQCNRRSVAIAGIMGGAETEVTGSTQEILLESANFDAATIRRAAIALGLRTEAGSRFEKSLDPNLTVQAIARFVFLARRELPEMTLTSRLSDCYAAPLNIPTIRVDPTHVSRVIGQAVSRERIAAILKPLGFAVRDAGSRLAVSPPSFRATKDVTIEADVIEEVARFIGYDRIVPVLPRVEARPHDAAADHTIERRTVAVLCHGGAFIEVHGYVWYDDPWLARIGFDPGPCVTLANPAAPHLARLRQTLLPGLYAACERNRHHVRAFQLLEIGSVFHPGPRGDTTAQGRHLGLAVVRAGRQADRPVWDCLRSAAETWAVQVARSKLDFVEAGGQAPWEDPVRCCGLALDGRVVGRASLVPLACRMRVDERMRTLSIGLLEVDLSGLDPDGVAPPRLRPPATFPQAEMDFSFLADARRRWTQLAEDLRVFRHPLLRRLHFVGTYEGESIRLGRRSFTVRAVLGDPQHTLTDADLTRFGEEFTSFLVRLGLEMRS